MRNEETQIVPNHSLTSSSMNRRSFLTRSALAGAAVAASPVLITACGNSPVTGGGDGGTVTFLSYLPLETLSMSPELLAVTGGHFEKQGLNVTLQPVKGSPQAMQTLLSGTGPITRLGQIDVMTAMTEDPQPMVTIGTLVRSPSIRYMYSKKNPLEKPEDFVGKTIGVPSEGGSSSKVVDLVMASAGLEPSQAKRQVVGLTPGTFTLVQQGRIAGYAVSIDTANTVLAQHDDAGVFDPGTVVSSDTQVYVSTEEVVRNQPEMLRKFLAGIRDSVKAMVNDAPSFSKTLETLRSEYSFAALDDDAIARKSMAENIKLWTGGDPDKPLLVTDKAAWEAGYRELVDAGLVKAGADAASWVDNSLLSNAGA